MGVWRDQEANPALEPWRGLPFFQTDSQGSSPCARILDKLDQEAAQKRAKEKEKAKKQKKRLDKVNHYRAIAGQKPLNPSQLNKKSKK